MTHGANGDSGRAGKGLPIEKSSVGFLIRRVHYFTGVDGREHERLEGLARAGAGLLPTSRMLPVADELRVHPLILRVGIRTDNNPLTARCRFANALRETAEEVNTAEPIYCTRSRY